MTTRNLLTTLVMASLVTASLDVAIAAKKRGGFQVIGMNRKAAPVRKILRKAKRSISFSEASNLMAPYKQWMIGANSTGYLYPKKNWNGPASSSYNLKGTVLRKFLQYEKQGFGRGINIGWTNNASAKTAVKRGKWFFTRKSNSNARIVYGESLALAWGNSTNSYIKYGRRRIGINLKWSKKPVYEWTILGGKPGQPVRKGKDLVVIYNLKHKQPMTHFKRRLGGNIGWPDSKSWKKQALKKLKKYVTVENAVKVLREIAKESQSS